MDSDILAELKEWLKQLRADKPHRHGEQPGVEISLVAVQSRKLSGYVPHRKQDNPEHSCFGDPQGS
jgi:hypothetical protein